MNQACLHAEVERENIMNISFERCYEWKIIITFSFSKLYVWKNGRQYDETMTDAHAQLA